MNRRTTVIALGNVAFIYYVIGLLLEHIQKAPEDVRDWSSDTLLWAGAAILSVMSLMVFIVVLYMGTKRERR